MAHVKQLHGLSPEGLSTKGLEAPARTRRSHEASPVARDESEELDETFRLKYTRNKTHLRSLELTWKWKMTPWKTIFHYKQVVFHFHGSSRESTRSCGPHSERRPGGRRPFSHFTHWSAFEDLWGTGWRWASHKITISRWCPGPGSQSPILLTAPVDPRAGWPSSLSVSCLAFIRRAEESHRVSEMAWRGSTPWSLPLLLRAALTSRQQK